MTSLSFPERSNMAVIVSATAESALKKALESYQPLKKAFPSKYALDVEYQRLESLSARPVAGRGYYAMKEEIDTKLQRGLYPDLKFSGMAFLVAAQLLGMPTSEPERDYVRFNLAALCRDVAVNLMQQERSGGNSPTRG